MPPRTHHRPIRVIYAEDDSAVAVPLKHAIEGTGCEVDWVRDGASAFDRISAEVKRYDILVTDHDMAEFSGLGLVSKLRDTGFSGSIIVFSSKVTEAEREVYRALAVDRILDKPASLKTLLAMIREIALRRAN